MAINILHSIDTVEPGGAETIFINLATRLNKTKFKNFCVVAKDSWAHRELTKHGIVPYHANPSGSFNLRYLLDIIKIIRKNNINLIQSHLLGSNVYCCLAGKLTGVPIICTFHGAVDFDSKRERFLKQKFSIINRFAHKIICVSNDLVAHAAKIYNLNQQKIAVIYNGVDFNQFYPNHNQSLRSELGFASDDIIIGMVGNVRPPKGYEYVLHAIDNLRIEFPSIKVVIAGDTDSEYYLSLIEICKQLKLENIVYFIGFRADIPNFINNIDIFLLSSISEGFSIATIEAMACNVPVIATKSGGPEEIMFCDDYGLLIDTHSSKQIAHAISQLLKNKNSIKSFVANANKMVKERFSIDTMMQNYEFVYEKAAYHA